MKVCDLCKTEAEEVLDLNNGYKTAKIKEICRSCMEVSDKIAIDARRHFDKIISEETESAVHRLWEKIKRKAGVIEVKADE